MISYEPIFHSTHMVNIIVITSDKLMAALLSLFNLLNFAFSLLLMFLAVDFDVPLSDFEFLLHFNDREDVLMLDSAADMEMFLASIKVA